MSAAVEAAIESIPSADFLLDPVSRFTGPENMPGWWLSKCFRPDWTNTQY
jgi:hypothetical protein